MKIYFFIRCYNMYGGSNVYSAVGDLLELRLGNYGEAIQTFSWLAYLRSATYNPRPTLEGMYKQHHEYLARLPKLVFGRKRKEFKIEFESKVTTAEDAESRLFSVETINAASREFITVLPLMQKRLNKSDDFDYPRFIADATRLLTQGYASLEEIKAVEAQRKGKRAAEDATKEWWEVMEIDWDNFHPTARETLNDKLFWDCGDDFAPHGNDTGADLMADYQKWIKRNPETPPMTFLSRLFSGWGITPIDWNITDEYEVKRLRETNRMELCLSNEAIIALAFAILKVKGQCPGEVSDLALKALQRYSLDFIEDGMTDANKELHRMAIAKMRAKLQVG